MSLATRCPACGTVFRVVSDQLKVSEGWVRCGRCSEVFNAAQRLFELEADAAPATPPQGRPVAEVHHLPLRDPAAASPALARVSAALAPPSAVAPAELEREPAAQAVPVEEPAVLRAEPAEPAAEAPAEAGSEARPAAEAARTLQRPPSPPNSPRPHPPKAPAWHRHRNSCAAPTAPHAGVIRRGAVCWPPWRCCCWRCWAHR